MLMISRKRGEWVRVGDALVQVVEVCGGTVRLGVQADRSIPVRRLDRAGNPELAKNIERLQMAVQIHGDATCR